MQNCSVLWCKQTRLAAAVAPGRDIGKISKVISDNEMELDEPLNTHAHLEHAGGTAELARATGVPIIGSHPDDQFWIDLLPEQYK